MIALTLAELTTAMGGRLVLASSPASAENVVSGSAQIDSRLIEPGDLFFAKRGEAMDGHQFAAEAANRGASVLVVEYEVKANAPQIVVSDTVTALGMLAAEVVSRVTSLGGLTVVGITGSNGKTTTKNLLREILPSLGETVSPENSFNNEVGAPLTMLKITAETSFLISEMGASAEGDIARLITMARPRIGVVLTVGLAHAGGFGGIESTFRAKSEMVTGLPESGVAVLNRDDPRVADMAPLTRARVVWFGLSPDAHVRATDVIAGAAGTTFTLHTAAGESAPVVFRVLGEHHVMNALAAAAVAKECGVPLADIVRGLEAVTRAERWRMEVMGGRDGITVINDAYNASPDSMMAALKTLALISEPGQRTVAVLGEMSELGKFSGEEHDRIGLQAVRLNISRIVVVGDAARRMHITAINEGSWDGESVFLSSQDEAFEYLVKELEPGDTVLVKSSNSAGLRFLGDRLGAHFA
ncbi:UDP-N-acetylmuramoyl-tripeptide--D-alanyl-D-alanine ligase [Klugiella xanthotipulae]|uniref:UDP-N-acetylmuramoyl-tripeptide--D-alanyl-D-alanine ligase n=1 Tax=Klugiella xanthotipulae TaxID=244735 RepID=A0A543HT37_9MICO|nr:UDP-N-acetylmuramoyl-tripeptide--D-alanyl-D-alanine ligase [Klugiella xanthotipulae]TQM61478.1 UDP-N-acetylmuramoyl-tripeptide--D-alanyl-D-alanine ligase [Klugiella xanthotipulae]